MALLELERQSFEIAFESALEYLSDGRTLHQFCLEYHQPLSPVRFRQWMFQKERTKQAYLVAKALGAEAVEDDLIRIADGIDPQGNPIPEDIQRSNLKINTRKWLLGVWNRKRYGETKQIEQTVTQTVDVSMMSTNDLRQRILSNLNIDPNLFDLPPDLEGEFEELP